MIKLRDYQKEALLHKDKKVLLLDMAVGTGKTFTSLELFKQHKTEACLIVVPASLVTQWSLVCEEYGIEIICLSGTKAKRLKLLNNLTIKNIICSYGIFRNDFNDILKFYKETKLTLILDEAQAIKSIKAKIHKNILRFYKAYDPKVLMLSGTIISSPADAYGILKLLNPGAYKNKALFEWKHVAKTDFFGNVLKWKNLDVLKANLFENAYSVKDEVLNLQEPLILKYPYNLNAGHFKLYKKVLSDKFMEFPNSFLDFTECATMFHIAQELIASPESISEEFKSIKPEGLNMLKDILNQIPEEPVVIFTRYINTTEKLINILGKAAAGYYGQISRKEKDEALRKFLIGEVKYLIANLQSAATGLDKLQEVSNHIIFFELPFTPSQFTQAIGRLRRSGQTKVVKVFIPYALKTIQENLIKSLTNKTKVMDELNIVNIKQFLGLV